MNFGFTEEQEMLRNEVRKFLAERCPLEEARRIMETPEGHSDALWKEMASLGWLGLLVPEEHGGVGLGWADLVVVLEEAGRALLPGPLLSSSLAVLALRDAADDAQQARFFPGIADGRDVFSVAILEAEDVFDIDGCKLEARADGADFVLDGEKAFVTDVTTATHFLVVCRRPAGHGGLSLAVVDAASEGVSVENWPCVDRTKRLGALRFDGVRVSAADFLSAEAMQVDGAPVVARLLDHAAAAVTAEMIGAAEAAHALVVDYANTRQQFGSLIGRFQGVKHPLAEMFVDIESFKSLLYYAAWALDESPDEAPRHVSMAKAYAGEAFTRIGIESIELHGAIGYTWEYDAQLYLKRSKWAKNVFGSSDHHYDRVATLGGL
jgi:alkylation response protein AidB-like acyl-CoA dehydrogenase